MHARRSRAVSLLVTSVVLTGFLLPGAALQDEAAAPAPGTDSQTQAVVDLAQIPAEPPVQPAPPAARELFGADCDTEINGSQVAAFCHNGYPQTDLVRLHVECDRWWDVDGDAAAVAVHPAGRVELAGRCWKEVRSAWVSHQRQ
ncbi:hypothetical protein OTB20_35890 [Streptomyces sp. H27-H1]|uniref:hypothetical protein n=1 Tax=Streptomyces sp. H27-H1 TaxID=2996461 RepID=UPI00226FE30F|nr:hypothetical protein [Streptomyces sp. H27-H1]MCY0931474.1 hypothetical protein [Streptomyces sp. H27-H1]